MGCERVQRPLQIGESIPAYSLPDAAGDPMNIPAVLKGRVVLIHFWADWCSACLKELAASKGLVEHYGSEQLAILAINLKQRPQVVAPWFERLALNYPVLFDSDGSMATAFGVIALPSSYLIDREGRLQRRIIGEMPPDQLEQLVKQMF
jgi:peroxiredoxin